MQEILLFVTGYFGACHQLVFDERMLLTNISFLHPGLQKSLHRPNVKEACKNSGQLVSDHFAEVSNMVELGSGAKREIEDWELSRYACYLIVQNADPKKEVVALGQTYFAVQTRKQELQEQFETMDEDKKRLAIRNELRTHNKSLAAAAQNAGVETPLDYAIFQNHGYKGLYGGLDRKAIHVKKGLKKSYEILDYMGSTELAANLFRAR